MSRLQWQPVALAGDFSPATAMSNSMQMLNNAAKAANNPRDREIQNATLMQQMIGNTGNQIVAGAGMDRADDYMQLQLDKYAYDKEKDAMNKPLDADSLAIAAQVAKDNPAGYATMSPEHRALLNTPAMNTAYQGMLEQNNAMRAEQGKTMQLELSNFDAETNAEVARLKENGEHTTLVDTYINDRKAQSQGLRDSLLSFTTGATVADSALNNEKYSGVLGRASLPAQGSGGNAETAYNALRPSIDRASELSGTDPIVNSAFSYMESNNGQANLSPTGVVGPMQVTQGAFTDMQKKHPDLLGANASLKDKDDNVLAGALYQKHMQEQATNTLGREATPVESYIAYNLGAGGSRGLLKASDDTLVTESGASLTALKRNKDLYFKGGDLSKPKTKGEVVQELQKRYDTGVSIAQQARGVTGQAPTQQAPTESAEDELARISREYDESNNNNSIPEEMFTLHNVEAGTQDYTDKKTELLSGDTKYDETNRNATEFTNIKETIKKNKDIDEGTWVKLTSEIKSIFPNAKASDILAIADASTTGMWRNSVDKVSVKNAVEAHQNNLKRGIETRKNMAGIDASYTRSKKIFDDAASKLIKNEEFLTNPNISRESKAIYLKESRELQKILEREGVKLADTLNKTNELFDSKLQMQLETPIITGTGKTVNGRALNQDAIDDYNKMLENFGLPVKNRS